MEQVWHGEFVKLFSQYFPNIWYLSPITQRPNGQWNYFMDSAKVRFCCDDCGHGWTSMKGRVVFWYFFNSASGEGIIKFKLYGQRCQKCNSNRFESAMWYPEEVVKVLVNIYNKVGQIYYGFYQPPIHKARRPGKPRNPHNQELCQACQDGVCSERRVSSTENSL
ncbi:RTP4 (predicted) [Pycnogonum litorale]